MTRPPADERLPQQAAAFLFDNTLPARHVEAGCAMIRARLEAGLPPDHLVIDRTAAA